MKEGQNEMGTDANIQPNDSVMIYPEKETHLSKADESEGVNVLRLINGR